MFKKIMIANRGEIAVRIIRACREMGIDTVAVYSTADKEALHVKLATESYCIGPIAAQSSYLNMQNLLQVALSRGCDAIHPGYGFLSENAEFANLVAKCGIKFIGPPGDVIAKMGSKSRARELMLEHGVRVVPGSEGETNTLEEAKRVCNAIGYPLLIKASAGGGGKGMRRVLTEEELEPAFLAARAEAKAAFGDDSVYIEKLILNPKHIEFQILADQYGNVIHLGERDCSIQRKNQKMIEESPSKALDEALRAEMGAQAVQAAKAADYEGAGTIEFVLDEDKNYYFIEMNTRIQVEHPVTEMVTGLDLIKEQIRIANGAPLTLKQEEVKLTGHAIEVRINAENPMHGFRPSPGKVNLIHTASGIGVRVDSFLYQNCEVSPFYDSMISKVIVHGSTRLEAIRRMRRALEEYLIEGIDTNMALSYLVLYHKDFLTGSFNTGFMQDHLEELLTFGEAL